MKTSRDEGEDGSSKNSGILIATIVIALASVWTAYIYTKQKELMEHALTETRKSASAAESSANSARRTLEVTNQAMLGISARLSYSREFPPPQATTSEQQFINWCRVEITGNNIGRSRAEELTYEFTVFLEGLTSAGNEILTGKPNSVQSGDGFVANSRELLAIFEDGATDTVIAHAILRHKRLRIAGMVRYRDIFGNRFTVGVNGSVADKISDSSFSFDLTVTVEEAPAEKEKK